MVTPTLIAVRCLRGASPCRSVHGAVVNRIDNGRGDAAVTRYDVTVEQFGYRQELARRLGLADMVGYGLIYMVPIAPFGIFGAGYRAPGGMPAMACAGGGVGVGV